MSPAAERLLEIYLADHLAAAAAGVALVRRAAHRNIGTHTGDALRRLSAEIEEDRQTLRRLASDIGFAGSKPKQVVALAAERLGRLKPNGQLRGYSPLSRVLELEALSVGIAGKLALWQALRRLAGDDERLSRDELSLLVERARRQRAEVEELRLEAVDRAFGGGVSGAVGSDPTSYFD
jgi:hypothetical protein